MVRESQRLSKSLSSFQSARAWGRLGAKSTTSRWGRNMKKLELHRCKAENCQNTLGFWMGFKISCILIQLMLLVPCGIPLQFAFLKPMARERFDDLPFWKVVHLLHSYFRLPEGIPIGSEKFSPRLRWICRRHNLEEHMFFFSENRIYQYIPLYTTWPFDIIYCI